MEKFYDPKKAQEEIEKNKKRKFPCYKCGKLKRMSGLHFVKRKLLCIDCRGEMN